MSMRDRLAVSIGAAAMAVACLGASAQQGPGLGIVATPEQVAGWDISIGPDGAGLPPGSGTARQGERVYAEKCLACHGEGGQGSLNDRLAGGHGTLQDASPIKTVGSYWPYATTIFDYVRRAMPLTQPLSLTDDEAYAVTAYLLRINGIIDDDDVIDAESLPRIEMPNRDNFIVAYPIADR